MLSLIKSMKHARYALGSLTAVMFSVSSGGGF
jgi:hypothetical protein